MMTGIAEYRDSGSGSVLKRMDEQFETVCAIMEKNGFQNIDEMTTYKFLSRLRVLESQKKQKEK